MQNCWSVRRFKPSIEDKEFSIGTKVTAKYYTQLRRVICLPFCCYHFSMNKSLLFSPFKSYKKHLTARLGRGVNVRTPIVEFCTCHFIIIFTCLDLTSAFCLLHLLHICAGLLICVEVVWCSCMLFCIQLQLVLVCDE